IFSFRNRLSAMEMASSVSLSHLSMWAVWNREKGSFFLTPLNCSEEQIPFSRAYSISSEYSSISASFPKANCDSMYAFILFFNIGTQTPYNLLSVTSIYYNCHFAFLFLLYHFFRKDESPPSAMEYGK